jgi:hypothetical protein
MTAKKKSPRTSDITMSRRIARSLFTNGRGERAETMRLIVGPETGFWILGGWSERAMSAHILKILRGELP